MTRQCRTLFRGAAEPGITSAAARVPKQSPFPEQRSKAAWPPSTPSAAAAFAHASQPIAEHGTAGAPTRRRATCSGHAHRLPIEACARASRPGLARYSEVLP